MRRAPTCAAACSSTGNDALPLFIFRLVRFPQTASIDRAYLDAKDHYDRLDFDLTTNDKAKVLTEAALAGETTGDPAFCVHADGNDRS